MGARTDAHPPRAGALAFLSDVCFSPTREADDVELLAIVDPPQAASAMATDTAIEQHASRRPTERQGGNERNIAAA